MSRDQLFVEKHSSNYHQQFYNIPEHNNRAFWEIRHYVSHLQNVTTIITKFKMMKITIGFDYFTRHNLVKRI